MIIDFLYQNAIAKLTEQGVILSISHKIRCLNSIADKVLFVNKLLHELNLLPEALVVEKSESLSSYYRCLGNQHFQKSNDYKAWQYYNLSLLYSPLNSHNYSFAIANRSAVLYSLKRYQECLNDIEKVFSQKYPLKLRDKLLKRQASCNQMLLKHPPDQFIIKKKEINALLEIKGEIDKSYVCASTALEVVYNEAMGRHVIAKENIVPGQVLAKEKPYFALLLKNQFLVSCAYCLSRSGNLYPCRSCCFVLYCSTECAENAWKEYHNIECPIMATLIDMEFTKLELLALRTVIKARSQYSDWKSLCTAIEDTESRNNTHLHGHTKVNDKWVYDSQYYPSIHSLATNMEKRSVSDIFQKCVTAAVYLHLLKGYTGFLEASTDDSDSVQCTAKLLLHHIMTSPTNMHGITCNIEDGNGNYTEELNVGSAPYAFLSLLNHSCAPNVVRYNKLGSGEMMLIALRPIKKGMQLFDNYG